MGCNSWGRKELDTTKQHETVKVPQHLFEEDAFAAVATATETHAHGNCAK